MAYPQPRGSLGSSLAWLPLWRHVVAARCEQMSPSPAAPPPKRAQGLTYATGTPVMRLLEGGSEEPSSDPMLSRERPRSPRLHGDSVS